MRIKPAIGSLKVITLVFFLFPGHPISSQDQKARQNPPRDDKAQLTYKLPVDIIVVSAAVTDRKGNPVTDLTAGDFKIYEDGKLQPIHTFALESYKLSSAQIAADGKAAAPEAVAEDPGYSRPRLISIVIDDVTSPADDHYVSLTEAVTRFIERDMGPGDQVSLLAGSGHAQYPFTRDKQLLAEQIRAFSRRLSMVRSTKSACPSLTDLQAHRIANNQTDGSSQEALEAAIQESLDCLDVRQLPNGYDIADGHSRTAANIQWSEAEHRNRTLIQTLRRHIRSLKHFQASKSIILFSNGFVFQELAYDLQDVVDQALRAGIVINTVDLRGLYTAAPQASDRMAVAPYLMRIKQQLSSEDLSSREGSLNMLAHDSGGLFFHNSNDLYAGLRQISERQACSYILTYAAPSRNPDGRYHRIRLEVSRSGLELSYRNGYYSPKEELSVERKRKEDILDALRAPGDVNEIPIYFSFNYHQLDDARYDISFFVQVDIRGMQFPEDESRRKNQVTLVVVAFDEADNYVDGLVKTVDFNLTPGGYAELIGQGITSKTVFQLAPGRYKIKAVVREAAQSRMGSVNRTISIP